MARRNELGILAKRNNTIAWCWKQVQVLSQVLGSAMRRARFELESDMVTVARVLR